MATTPKVTLGDGSTVELTRKEGVPDNLWSDVVKFVKENDAAVSKNPAILKLLSERPQHAATLMQFTNDSSAMKNFMHSAVLATSISEAGKQDKMKELAEDPELKPMCDDIKQHGPDALKKYIKNGKLMRKVSQKVGGINPEMLKQLAKIEDTGVSLHDAAKKGDLSKIQEFLKSRKDVDVRDLKGVTPLGYAVACDHLSAVKMLIEAKANLDDVDSVGNSAVHFAAGYGRVKVLEHLLARGAQASKVNQMGMTALAAAQQNQHAAVINILQRHGAK